VPENHEVMSRVNEEIRKVLFEVIDPELMVNVIDLGLVYTIHYQESPPRIDIGLTLTSPGCPLGEVIIQDIDYRLRERFPGTEVQISLIWDPPWTPDRLTEEGKKALGR